MRATAAALTSTPLTATADTFVKSGSPNQAQGALAYLRVNDSGNNRALVRFDPSAITAAVGAGTLTAAFLEVELVDNADNWGPDGRAVDVHRLTNATWTESGATWNCAEDSDPSNTSANCSGTTAWAMGSAGPNPWQSPPTDTQLIQNGQSGTVSWDVTGDVLALLEAANAPVPPPAGWETSASWIVKKADEGANGRVDFAAREGGGGGPRLVLLVAAAGEDAGTPGGSGNPVVANADSYIRQGARNDNQGGATLARVQSSGRNRALVSFAQSDLAAVVAGGTVTSATLRWPILRNAENWGTGRTVDLHRLTESWLERNVTWECRNDSVPSNSSPDCPTESWEMDSVGPNPWVAAPSATVIVTNATSGALALDVTADVQAFLAGTAANVGWILRKTDEGQAGKLELGTREGGSPPVLELVIDGADAGAEDAGEEDAGLADSGAQDAGPLDSGSEDLGPMDAGPEDAGPPDAGPPDTGPPDLGPPPVEICDNATDDDGDSLADCADPECATHPSCGTDDEAFSAREK